MRRLKSILISWDFGVALFSAITTYVLMPSYIDMDFALSFYNISMTVLSIVFSLFFTAMSIIMSSSDNDFIEFLEERSVFTELLWSFKFTLFVLFLSLVLSIIFYAGTSYWIMSKTVKNNWVQDSIFVLILEFCFLYGLLATWQAIMDTIKFSKYRSIFLKQNKSK